MPFYEIKSNGRFYDTVYVERDKSIREIKAEFEKLLKTPKIPNPVIKVRKMRNMT